MLLIYFLGLGWKLSVTHVSFHSPEVLFCYGKSIWPFWLFWCLIILGTEVHVAQLSMSNSTVHPSAAPAVEDGMKLQAWEWRSHLISTWFTRTHCIKEHIVCFKWRFWQFTKLFFLSSSYLFIQYCCCIWWPVLSSHTMQLFKCL